jgi:hypothetical protein
LIANFLIHLVIHSADYYKENLIKKYKIIKNYLLTDFNTERWKGINLESVKTQVENLNEKLIKLDVYLVK